MAPNGLGWFANRGQVLQIIIALIALAITGKQAWLDLMQSHFVSPGALLFYALSALVVLSFIWMVRGRADRAVSAKVETHKPEIADASFYEINRQINTLTTFEEYALWQLVLTHGMTGEQFFRTVIDAGIPVATLFGQREIERTFEHIGEKTTLLSFDEGSQNWAVRSNNLDTVRCLLQRHSPLFGI